MNQSAPWDRRPVDEFVIPGAGTFNIKTLDNAEFSVWMCGNKVEVCKSKRAAQDSVLEHAVRELERQEAALIERLDQIKQSLEALQYENPIFKFKKGGNA